MRSIPVFILVALLGAATAAAYDWEYVGMTGFGTTCIEADHHHDRILVGTYEGFWILDLATDIWAEFDDEGWIGRQVHAIAWDRDDPLRLVTGRENAFFKGYLEMTEDGGVSGQVVHMSQGGSFVDVAQDYDLWYACGISDITPGELLRSADGGETWTPLTGHGHTAMTAVAIGHEGEMAVAGDDQVWYSEDRGDTWLDGGNGLGGGLVHCLESYWSSGDVVFSPYLAGMDDGLWTSDYPFTEWWRILDDEPIRNVAVMWAPAPWPISIINRFVAITADGRVLVSDNEWPGLWQDETGNLPSPAVDVAFSPYSRDLYVCTAGGGVHRFHPVISGAEDVPLAAAATLAVWPNPFNPRANLRWTLPRAASGRLAVYDLAGRLVSVLREGSFAPGEHVQTWNAAGEASGVYVARLETDRGRASARLVLVR
jgi:hypothetical protein